MMFLALLGLLGGCGGRQHEPGIEDVAFEKPPGSPPSSGELLWGKFVVSTAVSEPRFDSRGNVVVSYSLKAKDIHSLWSRFDGLFNLDGKPVQRYEKLTTGPFVSVVAKYGPDGSCVWASVFDGELLMVDLEIDCEDNIVIASTLYGDLTMGGETLQSAGHYDPVVAKLDPDGRVVWAQTFPGDSMGADSSCAMALSSSGQIALAGRFTHNLGLGAETVTCSGDSSWFLVTMDGDGDVMMHKTFCPDTGRMSVSDLAWSPDGAVGLTGQSGDRAGWTTVIEKDASERWVKVRRGAASISVSDEAHGYAGRWLEFTEDGAVIVLTSHHQRLDGAAPPVSDSWILTRYSEHGETQAERSLYGSAYDEWRQFNPHVLEPGKDGEVMIAATVAGTVEIDGVTVVGPQRWGYTTTHRSVVIAFDSSLTARDAVVIEPRIMPGREMMVLGEGRLGVVAIYDESPFESKESWPAIIEMPLLSVFTFE